MSQSPRFSINGRRGNPNPNVGNLKPVQKGQRMPQEVIDRAIKNAMRTKMQKKLVKEIAEDIFYRKALNKEGDDVIDPQTGEHLTLVEIFFNRVLKKAVEVVNNKDGIQTVKDVKDSLEVASKIQELLGQRELNVTVTNAITQDQIDAVNNYIDEIGKKFNAQVETNDTDAETVHNDGGETTAA